MSVPTPAPREESAPPVPVRVILIDDEMSDNIEFQKAYCDTGGFKMEGRRAHCESDLLQGKAEKETERENQIKIDWN